ncbi:hypothetical protein EpJSE_00264 [Escherichia phage JSE]|uniref:Uncharacterized protein n=1 Tax=Escherichia phage JSE TaxID=576789 RepID=C4MZ82_9CAUD|nr:hypothetical protein EpJSE_00264 [Escherichia phage JSE]ACL78213.1 hypothetical protein EpJSE_00264 [Escherichia phage JSE]
MKFNNMKITKDWWDAMKANHRMVGTKKAEKTIINVVYKDHQDTLIKELIRAGNYQTPGGLIDLMVDNMYSKDGENVKQFYKQYYRKWQKYNRK